ncbi:hypothetical protein SARC_07063 [Sphaeroforma arctica JP610]|uniref:Uncharacterized protein n=1 Tax=Sphaeroforma arctica JP610 TaxID=667725 RepID=A0A0L0FVD6_9EUKA|nr:hypothetical protein SARC_07063 [Sphaeroforma arctica JP610]KNC80579.1 hypothetical protein SARC_07063 [Sphaeroforma arctica JP610]|eukprot:XP_014154481.1 hypothetical protein SARC_07063 [Sphaeroforma arctica JP610]
MAKRNIPHFVQLRQLMAGCDGPLFPQVLNSKRLTEPILHGSIGAFNVTIINLPLNYGIMKGTLNEANRSLRIIHSLYQEFVYNPIGIPVSTGRLLAHVSCSRATIALIRARADANEDEAREYKQRAIDEEYTLNQERDAHVQTQRKLNVLNARFSSTKEKLAKCKVDSTRAQLLEAEAYIGHRSKRKPPHCCSKARILFHPISEPLLNSMYKNQEEIRQHLVDVGKNIPDKYLICALLYSLDDNYKLPRADTFDHDLDALTIDEVYK